MAGEQRDPQHSIRPWASLGVGAGRAKGPVGLRATGRLARVALGSHAEVLSLPQNFLEEALPALFIRLILSPDFALCQ